MNHARLIYEDTPAFIPVPKEMQHRKTEITFLPMDDEPAPQSTVPQSPVELSVAPEITKPSSLLDLDAFFASLQEIDAEHPPELTTLFGKVTPCFKSVAEVDTFIRAERDAWDD
jgi:hypothetical protein